MKFQLDYMGAVYPDGILISWISLAGMYLGLALISLKLYSRCKELGGVLIGRDWFQVGVMSMVSRGAQ